MAYNQNIPLGSTPYPQSQTQILNNFSSIYNLILVNHGIFDTPTVGKHPFIEFPKQATSQITGDQEVGLYCIQGSTSGQPELAFRRQNAGAEVTFTESGTNGTTPNQTGFTKLPSGYIIKYGYVDVPLLAGGNYNFQSTVVFNPSYPAFSNIFNIQLTISINTATNTLPTSIAYIISNTITTANFIINSSSTATGGGFLPYRVYYYAVGN